MEVWPVIHLDTLTTACRNLELAAATGCEGVFIIDMEGHGPHVTDEIGRELLTNPWDVKVGVNYLGLPSSEAFVRSIAEGYHATWSDRHEFYAGKPTEEAHTIRAMLGESEPPLFFAAVAFKGQPTDPSPCQSAKAASLYNFIPTTSGPATGTAPTIDKVRMLSAAMPMSPRLALASGLTPQNVQSFRPYISHALVATGISRSFYEFDPALLRDFVKAAKAR